MKTLTKILASVCACFVLFGVVSFAGCKKKTTKTTPTEPEQQEEEIVVPVPNTVGVETYARYTKNEDGTYTADENGTYIMFGTYPTTKKASSVKINKTKSADGYWVGDDNEPYVKQGSSYYKVEPLMWKILSEEDGKATILCETIVDSAYFNRYYEESDGTCYKSDSKKHFILDENGEKIYANNYRYSDLRAFLNETFYNTSFTDTQKALINTVTVDNSAATTYSNENPYACENTEDKVWELSYKEAEALGDDEARMRPVTDYAKARGVTKQTNGCGWFWLRSPDADSSNYARCVEHNGANSAISRGGGGVVPALQITLN